MKMNIIQKIIFLLVLSSLLLTSFAVALTNQVAPSLQGNQFGFNPTTANYNVQEAAFVVLMLIV
jgi:hypothetical protein